MSERFIRMGIEIPLSLYANLDNIKNGSAAAGRILDAVKKEKQDIERISKDYKLGPVTTYKNSIYDEMGRGNNNG